VKAAVKPRAASSAANADAPLGFIPADPKDPRLTVEGAVCGADGRLDIEAYEDIMQCWASEPPPENHPDPTQPGVRAGEEVPKGLRVWDSQLASSSSKGKSTTGAGWVAVKHSEKAAKGAEAKRFNIRTCGSWRLAFLLARLQRALWAGEDLPAPTARQVMSPKRIWGRGTPSKRLRRQRSDEDSAEKAGKRLRRQTSAELREQAKPGSKLSKVMDRIRARVQTKTDEATGKAASSVEQSDAKVALAPVAEPPAQPIAQPVAQLDVGA